MTWDHERVEELLAGHALRGLDPGDAELAERAMIEHVPGCALCHRALEDYRLVSGDLALAASPARPPDVLLARLRRTARGQPRRAWRTSWAIGAAAAIVVLGLSAWNLTLAGRLSGRLDDAERQSAWLVDAVSTLSNPEAEVLTLTGAGDQRVSVMYVHGEERCYVVASHLPDPRWSYHTWFLGEGKVWDAGILETDHGFGLMPVETDPESWDTVLVTDEPAKAGPSPGASPLVSGTVD